MPKDNPLVVLFFLATSLATLIIAVEFVLRFFDGKKKSTPTPEIEIKQEAPPPQPEKSAPSFCELCIQRKNLIPEKCPEKPEGPCK